MLTKIFLAILISTVVASSGPPVFDKTHEDIGIVDGTRTEVLCDASGEEPILYTWHDEFSNEIGFNPEQAVYSNGSTLVFDVVRDHDAGFYTCSAKNIHGMASKVYNISVYYHPQDETVKIESVYIDSITDTSVRFSLDVRGQPSKILVKYTEALDKETWDFYFPADEVIELNGLVPSGNYSVQFKAESPLNNKQNWSRVYEVILLPEAPEVIFRSYGSGTLKIGWFRRWDDVMRKTIDEYKLSHRSVQQMRGNYWVYSNCTTNVIIPACASPYYTISGFSRTSHYEISLAAHTKSGYGKPATFKVYVEE